MRRISIFDRVSADGYFSAPDGNLDWTVPDAELDAAGASALTETSTVLFGRRTYEMFASFWPHALDDSGDGGQTSPDPHAAGRRSEAIRAMAVWLNAVEKIVFSRTLAAATWRNTRIERAFDPRALAALKEAPGQGIICFGSGSIVSLLAEHGLADEYHLVVSPLFLGGGRPLVAGLPRPVRLSLVEARALRSGNVSLRYEPTR